MGRLRRDGKRERGQILVLFELVLIVILGFAAMAIDLGVLRNNRQILVNTLDSAALAGGSVLPVDGSVAGKYAAELKLINDTIARDYPGLPASAYTISFRCLIGVNPTTQAVYLDEIPDQCNPIHALGHTPAAADFTRAGTVAHSACNPALLDKCNVVVIMGSAITDYKLAPVLGVANGSTGLVTSAACKGPCGNPQTVSPVDLVIILDRTGSMADNSNKVGPKIQALETAAKTVLSVYDPSKQRVALGLTGPGKVDASGVPTINSCSPGSGSAMGVADDQNFSPHATLTPSGTTSLFQGSFLSTTLTTAITTNGAISVKVASAAGFPTSGNYTIQIDSEQMLVTGGQGTTTWTVTNANRGLNATTKASHVVNSVVGWGVSKTDTTIKVNSAAGFPTTGSFTIKVDNEQMLVTSGAGTTTWTVTSANRGYNSTTAAVHGGNETVSLIYSTGATSIKVNSASGFPTSGSYTVVIDSEHMLVTGGQGTTTWTVTRGADSTTAATHIGGTTVTRVVGKTDTTIQVSAPYGPSASFPSVPFTIAVGLNGSNYEHMSVTAVAGSSAPFTWTVTRAQDSTPAATHNTGDDVDGVAPWVPSNATVGVWVPVGLSGTDTATPPPAQTGSNGTYSIGGVVQTGTPIVKTINCISAQSNGTNLTTPIKMAQWYLDHYGRPGVTQGIILETDGHPQVGFEGGDQTTTNSAYTCQAAIDAATAAKADYTNSPLGIQIFTIGYGVDSTSKCPTYTSTRTDSSSSKNMYESATWSGVQAKIMLKAMATNPSYFFDDPPSSDLADAFTQAAQILANTKDHLIQLYPLPVVTSAGGPVTSVTIGGQYFTGASNVNFGPVSAQILSVTDTSITAKVPAGPHGSIVDVTVRTPAGLSVVTTADQYTYP